MMRVAEKVVQRRVALALAHLCLPDDQKTVFIDGNGNAPNHSLQFWFPIQGFSGVI